MSQNARPRHAKALVLSAAALLALPAPASANVPVIDPTAIARIREQVALASQQLGAIKQQVEKVQDLKNVIGQMGASAIGTTLEQAGLNFSDVDDAKSILRDVSALSKDVKQLPQSLSNFKINGESLALSVVDGLASGRTNAGKIFYFNGSGEMTQATVDGLRKRRSAALRDAAINGYALATSMKGDLGQTQKTADALAEQAKKATDLRGDVQANTAALLAIYAETTKQTALQAQALEIESANTLSTDPTGKTGN